MQDVDEDDEDEEPVEDGEDNGDDANVVMDKIMKQIQIICPWKLM